MAATDLGVDVQRAARDALAQGDAERAVALLEPAMAAGPTRLSMVHDLVRALHAAGRVDEAIELLQRLVVGSPHHAELHLHLIRMLDAGGRPGGALHAATLGTEHHPTDAALWKAVATLAGQQGEHQRAFAAAQRLVELTPHEGGAWRQLAAAARSVGNEEMVGRALDGWVRVAPANPTARHLHAAYHGLPVERAAEEYVTALFDSYAERFDEHLAGLGYQAPTLVAERVQRLLQAPVEVAADLGCGTGQVGVLLRPWAERLVGVDLSSGMLAKARERQLYDELVDGELTTFLRDRPGQFDLLVSADTLNYVGDLRPVFAAASRSLRSGGAMTFTIEDGGELAEGYRLAASGRYVHDAHWVQQQLEEHGFDGVDTESCVLRYEGRQEVRGVLVTARRGH